MERTEPITYNVQVPKLRGMSEEKRAQALEDYIRENNRQIRIILNQLTDMIHNIEKTVDKERT